MARAQEDFVDLAFAANPELRKRVHAAIDINPLQGALFRDISTYILNKTPQSAAAEPASKKRKIIDEGNNVENADAGAGGLGSLASTAVKAWKTYPGVSFAMPQRKKLTLELVSSGKKAGGVRALGADGSVEFGIAWSNVDQIFCLPIPEKAKRQHNFVIIPLHGDGVNPVPENLKSSPPEPIVWTFEEATGKNIIEGEDPGPQPIADALNQCLRAAGVGKEVVFPDANEFASAIPQSHRKGEKAFHAKAHRGSKEGFLFFTKTGILYGFKKPLAYFDFSTIEAISYTNVLRNTFNLVITTAQKEDIEFSMVDQADYEGINEYVGAHGLQDASMAAARRAKKLNINKTEDGDKEGANGNGAEGDEETELAKAARLAQELEDEEEEDDDFDPGSEGESEGSGSGSDSEEDGEDGEGGGFEEGESGVVYDGGYDDEDAEMEE